MTSVSMLRLGLIVLAGWLAVVSARAEDASPSCEVHEYLLATESKLPKVAEAIKVLEDAGVLLWVQRIKRVHEPCTDLLGDNGWRWRVAFRCSSDFLRSFLAS